MSHYIKHPEAIWTTISKPFTNPVDWLHDVGETAYNTITAPNKVFTDTIGNFSGKGKDVFRLPTYDELGKPGQAFAERLDAHNSILPASWRPYAQPVESALLNFIPGVGPFASAAFNTAYAGGKQQQLNKGFDWGSLGKDAAINFGTAAVSAGANKLLANANAANGAKNFYTPGSLTSSANPQFAGLPAGYNTGALGPSALSSFNPSSLDQAFLAASKAAPGAVNFGNIGTPPSLSATGANASTPTPVYANAVQSSGIGDAAYKAAIKGGANLANNAITSSLSPPQQRPVTDTFSGFEPLDSGDQPQLQWGDLLNAFGGSDINTPNPHGFRIGDQAVNDMTIRLGANNYLQQNQAKDSALSAGQYQSWQNTPYSNRLSEISRGTDQSMQDLLKQIDNANQYYSVIDSNPGLTQEQLDQYLQDPSTGVLGGFSVPTDQQEFFRNLRPIGPQSVSLLH